MKNFKWDKKYLYWGVTAFCVVVASIAFFWVLNSWNGLMRVIGLILGALTPVIYGFLIAYLLNKIMVYIEAHIFLKLCGKLVKNKTVGRKLARVLSITVVLLIALGFIAGLLVIVLPELYTSIGKIVTNSSEYLTIATNWAQKIFANYENLEPVAASWLETISGRLMDWLENNVLPRMTTLITSITGGVISVVMTLVDLFIGTVISIYLLYNKEVFCAQAKKLTYSVLRTKTANMLMKEIDFINDAFGDYIAGTLIDAVVVGIVNYIFMAVMGMPYAGLVTTIVAVTNLIPVFGPFIGAIPSAFLVLLENPTQALIFLIFTVVLQQIDAQILKPRIHSSRTGLSGFWIMFAILLFGGLFGIVGMIIGVPVITVLYNIIRRLNNRRLRSKGLPVGTVDYMALEYVDPRTKEFRRRGAAPAAAVPAPESPDEGPEPAAEPAAGSAEPAPDVSDAAPEPAAPVPAEKE